MDPMILSVLYVWCQLNKDMVVTFWFGTRFKVSVIKKYTYIECMLTLCRPPPKKD